MTYAYAWIEGCKAVSSGAGAPKVLIPGGWVVIKK